MGKLSFAGETKTAKRQFLFAFWKTLCYTDKVIAQNVRARKDSKL